MQSKGLRHLHVSFSGHVGMLAREVFPIRASLAVYGYGELAAQDSQTFARIVSSMEFVRCISRHSRSMVMLASTPQLWERILAAPAWNRYPNTIKPAPFRERPRPFTLTYVGRLSPEKGQALLLEAVARLRGAGCDAQVRLVGDGPDRASLERQAARDSITSAVIFEGYVSAERLAACYRETKGDAFVICDQPVRRHPHGSDGSDGDADRVRGAAHYRDPGTDRRWNQRPSLSPGRRRRPGPHAHPADRRYPALRRSLGENGRVQVSEMYDSARNAEAFARILRERVLSE